MIIKKEIIVINENDNQDILFHWMDLNKDKLQHISEDEGCGCCVNIFTLEGEEKIINTIPKNILE